MLICIHDDKEKSKLSKNDDGQNSGGGNDSIVVETHAGCGVDGGNRSHCAAAL